MMFALFLNIIFIVFGKRRACYRLDGYCAHGKHYGQHPCNDPFCCLNIPDMAALLFFNPPFYNPGCIYGYSTLTVAVPGMTASKEKCCSDCPLPVVSAIIVMYFSTLPCMSLTVVSFFGL